MFSMELFAVNTQIELQHDYIEHHSVQKIYVSEQKWPTFSCFLFKRLKVHSGMP